jgi:hypothetical protein
MQVTRLQSFAFPLAEVAVAVASAHADFVDILLARLQQVGRFLDGAQLNFYLIHHDLLISLFILNC